MALFADPIPSDARLVLLVTTGPYAGLYQIRGTRSQLNGQPLPEFIPGVEMPDGRSAPCSLVRVTPRFWLYKECHGPQTNRFDERQQ